jgi:hypothetical protein
MPKVLTKLRVDEVSCVTKGAGEGTRIVLMKRDAPRPHAFGYAMPKPPSIYHEIFSRKRAGGDERRSRIRHLHRHIADGNGARPEQIDTGVDTDGNIAAHVSHLADLIVEAADGGVARSEALAWILTNRHGRAAVTHLTKKEVPKMNINKTLREVGEHGFTKMIQKYSNSVRLPNETQAQAFTRVFTSDDGEGAAIRRAWLVSKGGGIPADEPSDDDEADGENENALEELNELAEQTRQRNPGMSKAAAFSKVYCDPANARLAQRERAQNRPR